MELKTVPEYTEVKLRQLEVGVYGDIREVLIHSQDTLKFLENGDIYVKLTNPKTKEVLEETTFHYDHIQWHTIIYRTIRYPASADLPEQFVDPRLAVAPADSPQTDDSWLV